MLIVFWWWQIFLASNTIRIAHFVLHSMIIIRSGQDKTLLITALMIIIYHHYRHFLPHTHFIPATTLTGKLWHQKHWLQNYSFTEFVQVSIDNQELRLSFILLCLAFHQRGFKSFWLLWNWIGDQKFELIPLDKRIIQLPQETWFRT